MMMKPNSVDILLGRGVRINNHPGNEAYREIISENAATYAASTKTQKNKMSTNIVTDLINSYPPRRFLEKSETGIWQEVPIKRAVTKTSQALRDVARDRANKAAGVKKSTGNSSLTKLFSTSSSTSRHIRTISDDSIPSSSANTVPFDLHPSMNNIEPRQSADYANAVPIDSHSSLNSIEPRQNADLISFPPHSLQDFEHFETNVDLFLDEFNAGLLDDILDPSLDGILVSASDDDFLLLS